MSIQTMVNGVKGRVDGLACQGQNALSHSIRSFREGGEIVRDGLQNLIEGHTQALRDIVDSTKSGFDRARSDGLRAVVSSPVRYLPPKDGFIDLFAGTADVFSRTGDRLIKTVTGGLAGVKAGRRGETPAVRKVVKSKARTGAGKKKTAVARKAPRKTVRKTPAKVASASR